MQELKYLAGYSESLLNKVKNLIHEDKLGEYIKNKYPEAHTIRTDRALYDFTMNIKNRFLQKSQPLGRVIYDSKINAVDHVLGMHYYISKVRDQKLNQSMKLK